MLKVFRWTWVPVLFWLSGCASTQYAWQAATGHLKVLVASQNIDEVLGRDSTPARLRTQLEHVKNIRKFSVEELKLPDNRSYTRYADVGRPFVVWNVVASEPDQLALKRWCFPITGCISYKGYYSEADAVAEGQGLREAGYDVAVMGVPAYSTLGFTPDPVLNTFVYYPAGELARLIFHELAHQVVYIEDDTQFNESFATAVEIAGVEAWLSQPGHEDMAQQYRVFDERRVAFRTMLARARADLIAQFSRSELDRVGRMQFKEMRLASLMAEYEQLKASWGGWSGYDRFMNEDLNNAKLGVVGLYDELVPAFTALLKHHHGDFEAFYAAVKALGALPREQREKALREYANR
ncbi:aminopeptidase [Limnobacter sp.]|uniref:aminopeptidase n=1 Tax=Limnobacter sp. TaxID=2003368 RepID=UPI0035179D8A